MVMATLSTLFSTLGTAANTTKAFKELLANKKGEERLLLEELKRELHTFMAGGEPRSGTQENHSAIEHQGL